MRHFRIYTKDGCPHCVNAKALLKSYGFEYEEITYYPEVENSQDILDWFEFINWKSFPLILENINNGKEFKQIGGFTQLKDYLDDEL